MKLKRWDLVYRSGEGCECGMETDSSGEYVEYKEAASDIERLTAELEAANQHVTILQAGAVNSGMMLTALKAENEVLWDAALAKHK